MHAGLLLDPTAPVADPAADADLMITMLDGGLGAVAGTSGAGVQPRADVFCWCDCIVCVAPQVDGLTTADDLV
jgi:hypothetical protein